MINWLKKIIKKRVKFKLNDRKEDKRPNDHMQGNKADANYSQ